ncbi:MAG: matrixin family metalloprotease [Deltaproteobacteria bacterium]|nr:matrixin family metalloprotease [Deltaproteobacteria bacterium]
MCGLAMFLFSGSRNANAFCRSTTCVGATCSRDAAGCVTDGKPLVWGRGGPLTFRLHSKGTASLHVEEARAAIRAAFYRWSDVVCSDGRRTSLRFVEGELTDVDKPLDRRAPRPPPFGVYFRDNGWPHADRDSAYAVTNVDFGMETGTIHYADIELNSALKRFVTDASARTSDGLRTSNDLRLVDEGVDLQTVVLHEVGHFIGLAHSSEPRSIMVSGLCDGGDRCVRDVVSARRLGDDDRAAVCALFPPDARSDESGRASAPDDPSSVGCAFSGATSSVRGLPAGGAAAVAFGLCAFVRRRRRARADVRGARSA